MNNEELMKYRLNLIHDAIEMKKKPERVPHLSNVWAWMVLDAGCKLSDQIFSYEKTEEIVLDFQKKYNFDYLGYTGQRLNRFRDIFGVSPHKVSDEKEIVYYDDIPLLEILNLKNLKIII